MDKIYRNEGKGVCVIFECVLSYTNNYLLKQGKMDDLGWCVLSSCARLRIISAKIQYSKKPVHLWQWRWNR